MWWGSGGCGGGGAVGEVVRRAKPRCGEGGEQSTYEHVKGKHAMHVQQGMQGRAGGIRRR